MATRIAYSLTSPLLWHGMYRTEKVYGGAIPILTSDLAAGSVVAMFRVPKGFTVVGAAIDIPSLDSNASKTLTVSIGDAASATRLLNASNIGQAGTTALTLPPGVRGYTYSADTDILLTVGTGAATAAAGTLVFHLLGYIDA